MKEIDEQEEKKSTEYNRRLVDLYNFLHIICIEGGCGYDLKDICFNIIFGRVDYNEALVEWQHCGHKIFG